MSKGITNNMEMEEPFYVRRKPDPVPFSKFLYNKDKGTVLGRTGVSWGKQNFHYQCKSVEQLAHFNTNTCVESMLLNHK